MQWDCVNPKYRDKKKNYRSSGTVVLAQCTVNPSAGLKPATAPSPPATSHSALPFFQRPVSLSGNREPSPYPTANFNLKNSGPSTSPTAPHLPSSSKDRPSILPSLLSPGGEGTHLPGLHHGRLPDQLHGKGRRDGDTGKRGGLSHSEQNIFIKT